jgi:hypothetical protein
MPQLEVERKLTHKPERLEYALRDATLFVRHPAQLLCSVTSAMSRISESVGRFHVITTGRLWVMPEALVQETNDGSPPESDRSEHWLGLVERTDLGKLLG